MKKLFRPTVIAAVALGAIGVAAPITASADTSQNNDIVSRLAAQKLDNTIKLNNCSAAYVRFPASKGSDKGLMLTNGHCHEGGFIPSGTRIHNQRSSRSGELLDAAGKRKGTVQAEMTLYATMDDTDVTLYRLNETFDSINKKARAKPFTMSAKRPADKTKFTIPSGYWKRSWSCSVNGFVYTLREGKWDNHDSIRYSFPGCDLIHGTSGSPIINDSTLEVIGINNTGNDDGEKCTENNPCEMDKNGKIVRVQKGQGYGQQTYWFSTCLAKDFSIDLKKKGCKLPGGNGGPQPARP